MDLKQTLFIYFRLFVQNIKIKLEYKADFFIMLFTGSLYQVLGFLFLWVIYSRIPSIQGWTFWEMIFLYSGIFFTEGFVSFFLEGMWMMAFIINTGELDRYLLRPISPVLQIVTANLGPNGIGNMILGAILYFQAFSHLNVYWSPLKILYIPVFLISAVTIRAAITFASTSAAFWIKSFSSSFPLMVFQVGDFAKYPLNIFNMSVQTLIAVIVPYGFISFFPAVYIFDKYPNIAWTAWLAPLVATASVLLAAFIFKSGMKNYESAGS